ncbi:AT-rich interactive domain-containing protein 2 [Cucumis melo var. makuwa]|uniref:AT-rich interactive domain-containing protein 2 n=1 Tax=Cucumis melo var. makuwa TaxID=1194695 RepID=A0A5D3CXM4_CUCMM|nr:AT-rich interactive domain-containing protein 2 [Cucumis melo var. makuwa]
MGRWPISSNDSILDCNKDVDPNPSNGYCIAPDCLVEGSRANVDHDDCKATIRCYFEKILWVFLKEICRRGFIRPVPALLGEGGSLDLFELFMVVRDKGGYQVVSEKELWSSVVVELGLDLGLSASVKLIYFKYLSELEKWLMVRRGGTKLENGNSDYYYYRKSFPCLAELEAKIKDMLYGVLRQKSIYDERPGFKSNKPNGNVNVAETAAEKEIKFPKIEKKEHDLHEDVTPIQQNCTETPRVNGETNQIHVIGDCRSLDAVNVETETDSHGRSRESLLRMLKWVRKTAKHPANPSNGTVPESSKWKAYASDDALWLQVIKAKDALLNRKDVDKTAEKRLLIQVDFIHLFCLSASTLSPSSIFPLFLDQWEKLPPAIKTSGFHHHKQAAYDFYCKVVPGLWVLMFCFASPLNSLLGVHISQFSSKFAFIKSSVKLCILPMLLMGGAPRLLIGFQTYRKDEFFEE